jgi:hypothetical protein
VTDDTCIRSLGNRIANTESTVTAANTYIKKLHNFHDDDDDDADDADSLAYTS